MDDFSTVNNIVGDSIRNSSYISCIISSLVFITYTLIIKVVEYFKSKDKNKPIIEIANTMKQVSDNIVKLNSVLDKTLRDAEKKEISKCKNTINLAFSHFANVISRECIDIIINNHINTNKKLITENITKLVTTEYYKIYSVLSDFEINGSIVSTKLEKDWINQTIKSIIDIMYNGQETITRISQLNNRINVDINNYTTHIENKIFNN